ncbi:polysaccharide biosynthesis tyrosine autokinase [Xenophilus arseniciresistens]|uniref:Putative tyrosine-protein kinase EpsB n=1 Tax=Xenophilus arseniciresistens TaxID=1283306 RepID=A0AAE3N6Y8_9BURK|nr:polysaccharide biosynthesis tyrosine autokinase [Xenophilus arseniciresistens]MDA7415481.1 polysaccharide biosynthesis tyrosine autokinase [Xenophilus arseniciresistens]
MNAHSASTPDGQRAPRPTPIEADDDEINLIEYLDILIDQKWLIAGITAVALAAGVAYALLATPIYQTNVLVQVEDSAPEAKGFLGDAGSLFDVKTPATGEIQVIRSRMVLGAAVEQTRYYLDAQPRYTPFFGRWMAARADGLSTPGFLGMGGFVSGTERIEVDHFELPSSLQGQGEFTVTARGEGRYTLTHELLPEPLQGTVGQPLKHVLPGDQAIDLLITRLDGEAGAEFSIERASQLASVEELQRGLQISEQGRQSNVINVVLEGSDRARLQSILNAIGDQYVRQNVERKAAEAQKTLVFLDEQLPAFRKQLEASEDAFTRFRNQNGTVAFDEEARGVLQQSIEMQTKLLEAQQQRRELSARFTDNNVRVQTVDRQIGALQAELDKLSNRVSRMPTIQQDALRLERDVRVNAELYQSLQNNALQLRLVKEGKTGNVRLLDPAVQPLRPVKPQKQLVAALALVLGALAGVAAAIGRARLMGGLRDPQEIEGHTGLSVYATVPLSTDQPVLDKRITAGARGIQLLAHNEPDSLPVEALRSLRVALQFAMMEAGNNRVLITGPTPGIGKSFISANFAAIMAQGGKRVLLIDADLRKGHINRSFGLKREGGLSELLNGSITAQQAIHADLLPGLDLLTTGALPPNPSDMLMSATFAQLLESLSAQYDLVIVDTPPVLVAADTAAVAPSCGVVLMVARSEQTHMGEITESARRLAQAGTSVTGVVFNGMDLSRRHSGSYGYRYGGYRYTEYKYKA